MLLSHNAYFIAGAGLAVVRFLGVGIDLSQKTLTLHRERVKIAVKDYLGPTTQSSLSHEAGWIAAPCGGVKIAVKVINRP
jgi:hypothetical protein